MKKQIPITARCRECQSPATLITPFGVRCTRHGFDLYMKSASEGGEPWSLLLIRRRERQQVSSR